MSIIRKMNLINVHFWTYLEGEGWKGGPTPTSNISYLKSIRALYVGLFLNSFTVHFLWK